jgi:aminoglycoside phosphotransferase (APT) family kinase protein
MATRKMHADELEIDAGLVGRLLAAQFPQWVDRPIERVFSSGTDNALYRLGGDPVARLPRIGSAVGGLEKELRVLPVLAPLLPQIRSRH